MNILTAIGLAIAIIKALIELYEWVQSHPEATEPARELVSRLHQSLSEAHASVSEAPDKLGRDHVESP